MFRLIQNLMWSLMKVIVYHCLYQVSLLLHIYIFSPYTHTCYLLLKVTSQGFENAITSSNPESRT